MGGEFNGVRNSFGACLGNIHFVASLMLWSIANVPAVDAVWRPCAPDVRRFIGNDFGTGRGNGCSVIVKRTVELRFGRDTGG